MSKRDPEEQHRRSEQPPGDPLDQLTEDHRVILAVLDAIDCEVLRAPVRWTLLRRIVDFAESFAGRCHHIKEECELFPLLCREGLPRTGGPLAVIRHDHAEERAILERLMQAVDTRDHSALVDASRAYTYRLREHIDKENRFMFEQCRKLLSPGELAKLAAGFERVERETLGPGGRHLSIELARGLCSEAGVTTTF